MSYPLRSRFVYTGGDFTTGLTARPWSPVDDTIGGVRIAASGVPATYIVRRDPKLALPLRFEEGEWPDILALIEFGQSGQAFTWYPDSEDSGTSFSVYLHAPAPAEQVAPARDGGYPQMLELTLTLRSATGGALWLAYFP